MTSATQGGAPSARYRELVDSLLSENLSAEGLQELEQELDGNPRLQEHFHRYCQLHINLVTDIRSQGVVDKVSRFIAPMSEEHAIAALRAKSPDRLSARRQLTAFSYGGIAAGLFVFLSVVAIAYLNLREVSGLRGADGGPTTHVNDVISVKLVSNDFKSLPIGDVGTVYIQGPAHFELFGTRRAKLHRGRIKVRITDERGHGFVVETPRGHVTDLGTEFGVDVAQDASTDVLVFEGEVDLTLADQKSLGGLHVERLIQGDGLSLQQSSRLDRIMSVVTGNVATFQRFGEHDLSGALITNVTDNIRSAGFRKFYEIVPGGLREDALAYADRPAHDWNGIDTSGMPGYLVGADYVKPFNSDKMRGDVEISVTLSRPARLFVFFDRRVAPPRWLKENFRDTGDVIGMDVGRYEIDGVKFHRADRDFGPGVSIDESFSIWEMIVDVPRVVRLGPNNGSSELTAMYGIAAIPYE